MTTSTTTNIFRICARARDDHRFSWDDAGHLHNIIRNTTRTSTDVIEILENRTNLSWYVCWESGFIFPECRLATTVGVLDGRDCFDAALSDDGGYVWACDRHGDYGWTRDSDAHWIESDQEYITQSRYEWHSYTRCEDCGETFRGDDMYYREHVDGYFCESCDPGEPDEDDEDDNGHNGYCPSHNINTGGIYNYSRRVEEVIPVNLTRGIRYFGIELEQEFPDARPSDWVHWASDTIDGLKDVCIWKSDGSLTSGAELVSIPQTLDQWRDTDSNPIRDLCNNREWRRNARSHKTTTCGLHVHVSRETIPEPVVSKLVFLLNEPEMLELTTLVARRAPNTTYCMAQKKAWLSDPNYAWRNNITDPNTGQRSNPVPYVRPTRNIAKKQYVQHGRYTPVNLTDNTLEFRIFRGTLKWETVLASIEFCDAVISYCTQHGAGAMNVSDFRAWLRSSITRKTYPTLRDYLETRRVLPQRAKKPDIVTDVIVSEPEDVLVLSQTFHEIRI